MMAAHQRTHFINAQICRVDKQLVKRSAGRVAIAHDQLIAKQHRVVVDGRKMCIHLFPCSQRILEGIEVTKDVHFLAAGNLHTGNHRNAIFTAGCHGVLRVEAGIVIGDCNHVQSLDLRHAHHVPRRHVVICTGRKATVHVQIAKSAHIYSTGGSTPA